MRYPYSRLTGILLLCLVFSPAAKATHYKGGEMSYAYLGGNSYRLTVRIYHDCDHGDPNAAQQDLPMFVSIFTGDGKRYQSDSISGAFRQMPLLPTGACYNDTNHYCAAYAEVQKIYSLPPNADGYIFVNQRCCMSDEVLNITAASGEGLTLSCTIPGTASGAPANSGPSFTTLPPVRACINESFVLDFSATDQEGDSLAYRLTTAYRGGTANNAKPTATSTNFLPLPYAAGYTPDAPFGTDGTLSLDPATGLVTGYCSKAGNYLISLACDQYLNGMPAGAITRSYVVSVSGCGKAVSAHIQQDSVLLNAGLSGISIARCNGLRTIDFNNLSIGAERSYWDFGVSGRDDDTSTAMNPQFTYPAAGRYMLTLVAYGKDCSDTLRGAVWLSDDVVTADFTAAGGPCVLDTLILTDNSVVSGSSIDQNIWRVAQARYTGNPVEVQLTQAGGIAIVHTVITRDGCIADITRAHAVGAGAISGGNDTTVVFNEPLILRASGGGSYNWTYIPPALATDYSPGAPNINIFTGQAGKNFTFVLTGKDAQGCGGVDTVRVTVSQRGYAFVPSAFSPNGDGRNDLLKVQLAGSNFISFSVFNRRGNRVFQSINQQTGWDGRYKGEEAAADTYFWMVQARGADGKDRIFKGDVMLVR
jgi:gliding motility-associated-like protein